ncbi:YebC/PmpR family DNA-binding transcriptional regulator [Patescibacteria group bacterium]|nr:YebC/PmpR family DNA-binding transcriptional regulator [Patescibacteria group bacterium]
MSGHSKWSTIKHKKGMADAKRSANFTRLAREIEVAVRAKGPDPEMNFQLRLAIDRARAGNMPKDNIERAITRGSGVDDGSQVAELLYEAYAPGGTALIIECLTDNRNRTGNEVKLILSKGGATFANSGSVTYLFDQKGVVRTDLISLDKRDEVELNLIEAGADEIDYTEDQTIINCPITELSNINDAAVLSELKVNSAQMEWLPKINVSLDDSLAEQLGGIIEKLEDLDDVTNVYTNAE